MEEKKTTNRGVKSVNRHVNKHMQRQKAEDYRVLQSIVMLVDEWSEGKAESMTCGMSRSSERKTLSR